MIFDFFNKNKNKNSQLQIKKSSKDFLFDEWVTAKNAQGFFCAIDRLPNPDVVLRKAGKNISVLRALTNHYQVGACIEQRKAGSKGGEWELQRGEVKQEHYDIYLSVLKNLNMSNIFDSILDAPLFGYSPIEIIWEKQGNYIIPVELTAKPPEWFYFNSEREFFFKDKNKGGKRLIDLKNDFKFLLPVNGADYLNPYGKAILSRCFWIVAFINGGMEFWVKFSEKYGMPFMFGKYDRSMTDKEKEEFLDSLSNMVQDAVALIPNDGAVDIINTGGSGNSEIYEKLVTKCENNISKAILGQTLTTDVGVVGSYAASKTHSNVRDDIVKSDKHLIEETINTLLKFINHINFGDNEEPVFAFVSPEDLGMEKAERDNKVSALGVEFSEDYILRTYNYKKGDIKIVQKLNYPMNFEENKEDLKILKQVQNDKNKDNKVFDDFDLLENMSDIKELENAITPEIMNIAKFFNESNSYEDSLDKLAELYPDIKTKELQELLAKAIFISDLMGRLGAEQNNDK